MIFDFTNDNIDEIKKDYEYDKNFTDPSKIIGHLYLMFEIRTNGYRIVAKINELEERLKNYSGDKNAKMKSDEETLKKLTKEYDDMINKAEEDYHFYLRMLFNFRENYNENYYKEGAKDSFYEASKVILDEHVNLYIKNEKKIIFMNDKLKELFVSLNI